MKDIEYSMELFKRQLKDSDNAVEHDAFLLYAAKHHINNEQSLKRRMKDIKCNLNMLRAEKCSEQRRLFAWYDDKLNWCPLGLNHHEWLVDSGLFHESQFIDLVLGYKTDIDIHFYSISENNEEYVEDIACMIHNSVDEALPYFCD